MKTKREKIIDLYTEGRKITEIAVILRGVTAVMVRRVLREEWHLLRQKLGSEQVRRLILKQKLIIAKRRIKVLEDEIAEASIDDAVQEAIDRTLMEERKYDAWRIFNEKV